eukprot:SAG31_NODE_10372_length_1146_cov_4.307545_1_plen_314_part_10
MTCSRRMLMHLLCASLLLHAAAAATASAGSTAAATTARACSAAGNWTCGTAYHATATALPGGKYYRFVRVPQPPPGRSWNNATVTVNNSQLSVLFNSGHTDTGVLSADCGTIHWADKSVWYHNRSDIGPAGIAPEDRAADFRHVGIKDRGADVRIKSSPPSAGRGAYANTAQQYSVQLWVPLDDAHYAYIRAALAAHQENLTDISPYGMMSVTPRGRLHANKTLADRAKAVSALGGLGVWPLVGGSIDDLRRLMRQGPPMIAEAVALAKRHNWSGFNLDFELHVTPPQPGVRWAHLPCCLAPLSFCSPPPPPPP